MPRKSTGKRTRFEVFKRDGFTCQYCGAQPPDAVLVLDHIEPVAGGGASTIDNLITACEPCNQGKADKRITEHQVRPDADTLYLEARQEIAELRRYQEALAEREGALASLVDSLQGLWESCAVADSDWVPADYILRQMINKYDAETVEMAIREVAPKAHIRTLIRDWVPYMWAVLRTISGAD
jgi:hypothetical protein